MDITYIYNISKLFIEREYIKDIIALIMDTNSVIYEFNDICKYNLIMSNDEYINQLYYYYISDSNIGHRIMSIIIEWYNQNIYSTFNMKDNRNAKQRECIFWLKCIIEGNISSYYESRYKSTDIILINKDEYDTLKYKEKELEDLNKKYNKEKGKIKLMIDESTSKLKDNQIKVQQKNVFLNDEVNDLKNENKKLKQMNELLIAKNIISNSDIIIFGICFKDDSLDSYKKIYKLNSIKCYSALDDFNKVSCSNSDYVIFCTSIAKHSVYRKAKSIYSKFFHTDKTNLDNIFDEFLNHIKKENEF